MPSADTDLKFLSLQQYTEENRHRMFWEMSTMYLIICWNNKKHAMINLGGGGGNSSN